MSTLQSDIKFSVQSLQRLYWLRLCSFYPKNQAYIQGLCFHMGFVHWNIIPFHYLQTSFDQRLKKGWSVDSVSSRVFAFPIGIPRFTTVRISSILFLSKLTRFYLSSFLPSFFLSFIFFYPLIELFLSGGCRKKIHFYEVVDFG